MYTVYIDNIQYTEVAKMNIIISNANNQPIYQQIYEQVKNLIIASELKESDLLPSIRNLAKDLKISVITTKRAYEELERDGYIYSVAGKGCYVAKKNMEFIRESNLREIEDYMIKITQIAHVNGMSNDEIIKMFRTIQKEI